MTELLAVRAAGPVSDSVAMAADAFKVRSIDLYLTSVCNRRCTFCFLSDEFLSSRKRMTFDMAEQILRWAALGSLEEITILGGEPATHPDFAKIVATASTHGLSVRTVTNGSRQFRAALRDPATVQALNRVAVSIDASNPQLMDGLRGRGAFADAVSTVGYLAEAGIPYDINCTVVRSCLEEFPDMLHFGERLGAKRLNVHWFSAVGRAREHAPDETISADDWHRRVLTEVQKYRPPRADYVVDCELAYAYGLPGEDVNACAVRERENLQFFPSGAVFACGLLVEDEASSGYVWQPDGLYERGGITEITHAHGCSGCPFRATDSGYRALCIYNRLQV